MLCILFVLARSYTTIIFDMYNFHNFFPSLRSKYNNNNSHYDESIMKIAPNPLARERFKKKRSKEKLLALNRYASLANGWNEIRFTLGYSYSVLCCHSLYKCTVAYTGCVLLYVFFIHHSDSVRSYCLSLFQQKLCNISRKFKLKIYVCVRQFRFTLK